MEQVELLASSMTAPESGGRQPRICHAVNDPLLLAPQRERTSNPPWMLVILLLPLQSAHWTPQRQSVRERWV